MLRYIFFFRLVIGGDRNKTSGAREEKGLKKGPKKDRIRNAAQISGKNGDPNPSADGPIPYASEHAYSRAEGLVL